ncbi:MAG: L,D-transpeptidase family protein [Cryobacterium sp.]|nr:L,D-transpeptidase family protein [Oligoflexia bacterium]
MRPTFSLFTLSVLIALLSLLGSSAEAKVYSAILVDKATNTLEVVDLQNGEYLPIKKFHATLGKVKGDKEQEGDQKTPEGIYTFKARLTPPSLKKKFGVMAFYVNYPNDFDKIAGRTGFDIMLHATDVPDRLKQDYDSEGCVVVKNEELSEIAPQIKIGLTPILIFQSLTDEYRKPGKDPAIRSFFESWIKSWEQRDLTGYIGHYHSDFSAQGKDREGWKKYKAALNTRYSDISIGPEDVLYYRHPKYWMITFTQNYRSKLKGGGWGHRSRGTKILYVAEEAGEPKIIAESFTQSMW